jgi:hypothetical protein
LPRARSLRQINPPLEAKLIMGHGSRHHPLSPDRIKRSSLVTRSYVGRQARCVRGRDLAREAAKSEDKRQR